MNLHIGNRIKEVMAEKEVSAVQLAQRIYCSRTHIYRILEKDSIDTFLLTRISAALDYDFFKDISDSISKDSTSS